MLIWDARPSIAQAEEQGETRQDEEKQSSERSVQTKAKETAGEVTFWLWSCCLRYLSQASKRDRQFP